MKIVPPELTIQSDVEYKKVAQTLGAKKRPAKVLRLLMNSLESYRQARKYGWSRPWNKYDLINFQSFKLDIRQDVGFVDAAKVLLGNLADQLPADAMLFVNELFADKEQLMGFVFCHEYSAGGERYEGATLSFGRVNAKRYRDRIDIILEAKVVGKISLGFTRARIYIDPYRTGHKAPLWKKTLPAAELITGNALFEQLSAVSWQWQQMPERHWDHWTSAYIDYFAERQWPMQRSCFFCDQAEPMIPEQNAQAVVGK